MCNPTSLGSNTGSGQCRAGLARQRWVPGEPGDAGQKLLTLTLSPTQAGPATVQGVRSGLFCQHIGIPWGVSLRSGRFRRTLVGWLPLLALVVASGAVACMSQRGATAGAESGASTALHSVGLLDVLQEYASGALPRAPCIHAPFHPLATHLAETCRPAVGLQPARASAGQDVADLRSELSRRRSWGSLEEGPREFYFTRAIYSGSRGMWGRGRPPWATDYPKADLQFVFGLRRLTRIDAYERDHAMPLTDPELSRFPFLYALEVGYMSMTDAEVEGLRRYLLAGGFLFIDDFWGTWEWRNFEYEIGRVLPDLQIVDLPLEHPIFHTFYDIDKIIQVPSVRIIRGGPTWEQDGYVPYVKAIFGEDGRLMVIINWNTDLGDAWEWVDNPYYPLEYSNFAYQMAINAILYAMSH